MSKTAQTAATDTDTDTGDNATSKNPPHYLMWFRRDLRIHDNTALAALCERAKEDDASVSAIFFLTPEQWQAHDTSLVQVDHIARTLPILANDLQSNLNITLTVQLCPSFADCIEALTTLCNDNEISCVMANHEYEGNEIDRDEQLSKQLAKGDIEFVRWHDQCILPPQTITTNDGDSMYKVFTPFYKKWRHTLDVSTIQMHEVPTVDSDYKIKLPSSQTFANTIDDIKALNEKMLSDYQQTLEKNDSLQHIDMTAQLDQARDAYPAGESAACQRLEAFVDDDINNYDVSRDVPHLHATSQLSAYLTIGSISPRLCYLQASKAQEKLHGNDGDNEDINRWISELAWRDFYRHVLVEKPNLIRHKAYKEETDTKVNWSYDNDDFETWCTGKTGVPLVDAAMRCLNATGFMHNRLRMVTAMFLTKDLLIDWRLGERYFMQQLIDGDFASNNGGWQWSASTGTDSAPYFRIMNPFSQANTHDSKALFIKTWLPELKDIPNSILHNEDKMRKELAKGGKFADVDYPAPMVEHKSARKLAIAEFKKEA
ncbi:MULTISPECIES: FAD-binding domain-containing protein [unclassified Psychrobacter]|uniref:cryptochrome/photolyase family protein n=1 Tax=unclassified Psychrobacter TaxID=196806 RepID=UPI00086C080E|nr:MULTISPECIES: FAD-binding domain-containing protein [unclassified Psychrobacter]MBA6243523.1 deoxyribodipyrimidine photo-lyase [Psychrobacter sp. Urea-trap-18]MBA6286129.1 deoxyribodipyrimidine photo-lyase [Psychrobacter sp. Urea-trap-16]MBA6317228.1 deoxyribodipyrimidine photo-lyase [Psychrobacter sp. Urea-trap-20]MBA6334328.1 deoxyribodipyrimidine photo-lyase [Psychrobacter sp. Urea-trap-19]OEH66827.1 MAG: deoxyribodipyrimidine photolyase [Psychrobacter sp. B29-1]|tara:strand:- start:29599 stop:31227 length:1629 start_codon:yes stop_codon:yes gene_type:complete